MSGRVRSFEMFTFICLYFLVWMGGTQAAAGGSTQGADDEADIRKKLKVVTINVWSGLDYSGSLRFGEYESRENRERRFALLVTQLRSLDPDVVFLQEANPAGSYSERLADSLSFDEIHQVCNAGIKIAGFGPPWNFEEGIAIIARKELRLREYNVWKLSGSFGLYGDAITLNFDESEFALIGSVDAGGRKMFLVNVHFSAMPPHDAVVDSAMRVWSADGSMDSAAALQVDRILDAGPELRVRQADELVSLLSDLPQSVPVILGGDFNAEPASREIAAITENSGYHDTGENMAGPTVFTWDPVRNRNISYSTNLQDIQGNDVGIAGKLSAVYDTKPRRIDYVFVSKHFDRSAVRASRVVLDSMPDGLSSSDHFGYMTELELPSDTAGERFDEERATVEPLPILSYDTDIGLGYGAKLFLFDVLKTGESFDMVAFNSTKGERWYRLVYSIPDIESRQGKVYNVAFDFTFDYDKWLRNNFFGIGNNSQYSNREEYTREPIEFDFTLSRGFTPEFVGQFILRHKSIRDFNFGTGSVLSRLQPSLNAGNAVYTSVDLSLRYDTRNSFVNATRGVVLMGETEFSPDWSLGNTPFVRLAGWFQYYYKLFYPTTVFALRVGAQQVSGKNLPVQVLTSIGGNNTMRGYPQDRFLDRAGLLVNSELRFPIYWRIGGVVGLDAGKVWESLTDIDLRRWAVNPVAGLRLYMDNFVVRADFGFGADGMGFYFNFGQLF